MHFDLFHELAMPPALARSEQQAITDWLEEIALADRLGFHGAWLVEHHFMRAYSHVSKPEILLAAAAMRTETIRLGLGVIPAPFHHPIHIAERVATLDLVSGGRLEVGLGRGFSPLEHAAFGVESADSAAATDEALRVLRDSFTRRPVHYRETELDLVPHPLQAQPPLWSAAITPSRFEWAAQQGLGVLAGPFKPWFMTRGDIARYREHWTHAAPPRIGMTMGMLCLPDGKRARELARPAFEWFYKELFRVTLPVLEKLYPGYEHYRELGRFRHLMTLGVNMGLLQTFGMAIAGTPEECVAALRDFEQAGITHCLLSIGAGALPTGIARESMQCIAEEVMPCFAGEGGREKREG